MGYNDNKLIRYSRGSGQNFGKVENRAVAWGRFCASLSNPTRTSERFRDYVKLSDKEQVRLKAVSGFFYRTQVEGKRRNRSSGKPSDLITLDFDAATPEFLASILNGKVCGDLEWFLHTTRRHTPEKPRFRLILPLPEPVTTDIYGPVSRIVALRFDPEFEGVDKVSFRAAQMMFWPTVSADGEFIAKRNEGALVDWQAELDAFEMVIGDWRDVTLLPKAPGEELRQIAEKAEVPTEKQGPVGDFCRAYDVPAAIETFLPDIYEESDAGSGKPRYTYLGGTTVNGAEVQDGGLFLYSHHGSDPAADQLCNAFDLVRIHKFGHLDEGTDKDKPIGQRPSFIAMLDFIRDDPGYIKAATASRYDLTAMFDDAGLDDAEIDEDENASILDLVGEGPRALVGARAERVGSAPNDDDDEDLIGDPRAPRLLDPGYRRAIPGKRRRRPPKDWHLALERDRQGNILSTSANIATIIQYDPRINEAPEYCQFTQETRVRVPLRTRHPNIPVIEVLDPVKGDLWTDVHSRAVRALLESPNGPGKLGWGLRVSDRDLDLAIDLAARQLPFHPVKDRITATRWDGRARLDTLFVRYLNTPNDIYFRTTARLFLTAAVARIFEPAAKFDFVPILEGKQGIRKSAFIETLAMGFFAELTCDLHQEQKVVENLLGGWIIELPELSSIKRSDVESIKAAISRTTSVVRLAYARRAQEYRRQAVFMGSTNEHQYLVDQGGNRRFWPIPVQTDDIDTDALAAEAPQVVAEALQVYLRMRAEQPHGTLPLYLRDPEAKRIAEELAGERVQEDESSWIAEKAEAWLLRPLSESLFDGGEEQFRDRVTTSQIWHEACGMDRQPSRMDSKHVGQALRMIGWGPANSARVGGVKAKLYAPMDEHGNVVRYDYWRQSRENVNRSANDDEPLI